MEITIKEKLKLFRGEGYSNKRIQRSSLTKYKSLDNVYLWTNEELKRYYAKGINGSVLTVTGSGDHPLHAVLGGAKEVHAFDVNEFSKYLSMLKVSLMKNVSYQDFYKYMSYLRDNTFGLYFCEIERYLNSDEIEFWINYIKYFENSNENLFLFGGSCSPANNAYISENIYKNLQKKLEYSKIFYHDVAAEDLTREFKESKFSIIYLSNILGRIEKPCTEVSNAAIKLLTDLEMLLADEGQIYDYSLRVAEHECYRDERTDALYGGTSFEVGTQKDSVFVYTKKSE